MGERMSSLGLWEWRRVRNLLLTCEKCIDGGVEGEHLGLLFFQASGLWGGARRNRIACCAHARVSGEIHVFWKCTQRTWIFMSDVGFGRGSWDAPC